MILNNDQQKALSDFNAFLKSDKKVFILRGAAGTGKTTILREFIQTLNSIQKPFRVVAPTGRAALVSTERTGCRATTVHRLIYEIESHPQKVDDRFVFKLKENRDTYDQVYFADESSMLSDMFSDNEMYVFGSGQLLKDFISFCNVDHSNRKIVFIGDHAQLPPVGQSTSPALDIAYLAADYGVRAISTTLNEVVRQTAESQIVHNAQRMRDSIDKCCYNNFSIIDGGDVCTVELIDFEKRYTEIARLDSVSECVVVTYSNRYALNYNKIIRKIRYGQDDLPIREKDILLVTHNTYKYEVELYNGSIVRVVSVDDTVDVQTAYVGKDSCTLYFRSIVIESEGLQMPCLIIDDFLTSADGALPYKYQKALWSHFEQRMNDQGIKRNSEMFIQCARDDKYINALQCKYGYAITCHKAQGGEWKNVFVDMSSSGGKANESYFRWAYTAITRAKKMLFHISSPNFKESDFIVLGELSQCAEKGISYYHPQDADFLSYYYDIIKTRCGLIGVSCKDDRCAQYQHRITFVRDDDGVSCRMSLWYGKKGYNRKIDCINSDNEDLKIEVLRIIKTTATDGNIPYVSKFEKQSEMNDLLVNCAKEHKFNLTNIEQAAWSDIYYFAAESGICIVELYFSSKGVYTKIQPKSSNVDDESAIQFVESLKSKVYGTEC